MPSRRHHRRSAPAGCAATRRGHGEDGRALPDLAEHRQQRQPDWRHLVEDLHDLAGARPPGWPACQDSDVESTCRAVNVAFRCVTPTVPARRVSLRRGAERRRSPGKVADLVRRPGVGWHWRLTAGAEIAKLLRHRRRHRQRRVNLAQDTEGVETQQRLFGVASCKMRSSLWRMRAGVTRSSNSSVLVSNSRGAVDSKIEALFVAHRAEDCVRVVPKLRLWTRGPARRGKSASPPHASSNSPQRSGLRQSASVLIVKSRRCRSSLMLLCCTVGSAVGAE